MPVITNNILGGRAGCSWCGKSFRRQRLAQRFCSVRCQKTGRRAELAAGARRSRTLTPTTGVGGFPPKNGNNINILRGCQARSTPVHLAGRGYRFPNATPLDPALCRAIIRAEIGGQLRKPPQEQNAVLYNEAAE
jgi:hypothetical protein